MTTQSRQSKSNKAWWNYGNDFTNFTKCNIVLHCMVQLVILFLHNIVQIWNLLFIQLSEIRWIISQHGEITKSSFAQHGEITKFSITQHGEIQIQVFHNMVKLIKLLPSRENPLKSDNRKR